MSQPISRRTLMRGTMLTAATLATAGAAGANPTRNGANPVSLTQQWDKTFRKSERVDHRKVTFKNRYGITLAGDLYLPKDRGRQKLNVNWYMQPNDVTPTRESNEYPQPKNFGPYWRTESGVAAYKDASFVKVKNITLGYTIPSALLERAHITSLRVYGNVLNPFVFTKYQGFDPEWADAQYMDGGMASITYQFGLNVKF